MSTVVETSTEYRIATLNAIFRLWYVPAETRIDGPAIRAGYWVILCHPLEPLMVNPATGQIVDVL